MKLSHCLSILASIATSSACGPKSFEKKDMVSSNIPYSNEAKKMETPKESVPEAGAPDPQIPHMEEALPPQIVSGASLLCERTATADEIDCFWPNDKGGAAKVPASYKVNFNFQAASGGAPQILTADRRDGSETHFILSIKDLGAGSLLAKLGQDLGEANIVSTFDLSKLPPATTGEDTSLPARTPTPAPTPTPTPVPEPVEEVALTIVQMDFGTRNLFGDASYKDENDSCYSPPAGGGTPLATAGATFTVSKKVKGLRIELSEVCGLQTDKLKITIQDANGKNVATNRINPNSTTLVLYQGDLDPGDYTFLLDNGTSILPSGGQDNFSVKALNLIIDSKNVGSLSIPKRTH